MSDVSSVTKYFATANEGFVTTLGSSILSGAATVPLTSAAGLTNGTVFVGIIEPGLAKQQVFTGTVDTSGVQITGVVWTRGANADHSAGVSIVDYVTGTAHNMLSTGILKQHTQAGAHGAITGTSLAATGNISSSAGTINAATVSSLQDASVALSTYRSEAQTAFTVSGGVWSGDAYGSTKAASMTSWIGYINGQRGAISAVTARTFTASKDTYVDVLNTAGVFTLVYTEVTNNAASPALAANSMRLAIVVTGASNIAAATSINAGEPERTIPTTTNIGGSGNDSLGNPIRPRSLAANTGWPQVFILSNVAASASSIASATYTDISNGSISITLLQKCKVVIQGHVSARWVGTPSISANANVVVDGTQLVENRLDIGASGAPMTIPLVGATSHAAGTFTVKCQAKASTGTLDLIGVAFTIWAFPEI